MAICPEDAILIKGREVASSDFFDLPDREKATGYEQLSALLDRRRSIRKFSNKEIDKETIEKILVAARTAPMGLPPSDVNVMILDSIEKNRAFARDFCEFLGSMQWFVSKWFLAIMRPFWGKVNDEMFRGFIRPMVKLFPRKMREGENVLNYDAPLSMYFYGTPYTDPADPVIAATYAMIAGESLGLGTCMIGSVHPFIQNGKKARLFREKYNIKYQVKGGTDCSLRIPFFKIQKGNPKNLRQHNGWCLGSRDDLVDQTTSACLLEIKPQRQSRCGISAVVAGGITNKRAKLTYQETYLLQLFYLLSLKT